MKTLADVKRAISGKRKFEILEHYVHPELAGEIRTPNIIQTNGFYSITEEDPSSYLLNYGKGRYCEYGKASDWKFLDNDVCILSYLGKPIFKIRFI